MINTNGNPNGNAKNIAETLLVVTLNATQAIQLDDWELAGQLLRRREQLLTQLERFTALDGATSVLEKVRAAEKDLLRNMEKATSDAFQSLLQAQKYKKARKAYQGL
ncbi:MAG TPA: hypothetical protein VNK96_09455 [Fimbriimonadales bacterium]|nr:hypothetical protein [Fimbriimonadales bacterium]